MKLHVIIWGLKVHFEYGLRYEFLEIPNEQLLFLIH